MLWRSPNYIRIDFKRMICTNSCLLNPLRRHTLSDAITVGSKSATSARTSSSGEQLQQANLHVYQINRDVRLTDATSAHLLVDHLQPEERVLLLSILMERQGIEVLNTTLSNAPPTFSQLKQVFMINTIPFIGFGILDNMIMLLAGEYIDQTLGALLGISTMAAAALGNIISDVAGVGLAHYVEKIVVKLGFRQPDLSPVQLEMKEIRFTINGARAFGLVVGCLIGMFPLLFFKSPHDEKRVSDESNNADA